MFYLFATAGSGITTCFNLCNHMHDLTGSLFVTHIHPNIDLDGFQVVPTSKYYRVVQHRNMPKFTTEEAEEQMEARASVREVQRSLMIKQTDRSEIAATRALIAGELVIKDSGSTIRSEDAAASGFSIGIYIFYIVKTLHS